MSISQKLVSSISVLIILIASTAIYYNYRVSYQNELNQLNHSADEYLYNLENSMTRLVWNFNVDAAMEIGKAYEQINQIIAIRVVDDSTGTIFIDFRKKNPGNAIVRKNILKVRGEATGSVILEITDYYVAQRNKEFLIKSILLLAGIIIIFLGVSKIIFKFLLVDPIKDLETILTRYANGNYQSRDYTSKHIEFQRIVKTLETMGLKIQEQIKEIKEAESKYKSIFLNSIQGIIQISDEGHILNTNPSLLKILGYTPGKVFQIDIGELASKFFVYKKDYIHILKAMRARRKIENFETQFYRIDKNKIDVSISIWKTELPFSQDTIFEGTVIDITSRKQAESKLNNVKAFLKNIIDAMPSILIGVDSENRIIEWNQKAEAFTGLSAKEATGLYLEQAFPQLMIQCAGMTDIRVKSEPQIEKLIKLRNKGHITYNNVIRYPLKAANAKGAVIRIDDMTDQVNMQEKIIKLNEDLEKKVEERTLALKNSLNQLQQTQEHLIQSEKMAALGNLVAGVAHEINTPVGIGVTESSFLLQNVRTISTLYKDDQLTAQKFESFLTICGDSARSIFRNLTLTAQLINSFKQTAVDQTWESKRDFFVKKYIEEVLLSLKSKFKNTQHEIVVEIAEDLKVNSYPGILAQIINNLVINTLLHGFGEQIKKGIIKIKMDHDGQQLYFEYSDTGVGMNPDVIQRVFDPFFTTKRNQGGTGLGMHIVYNLITHKLKGSVTCKSGPNKGVVFKIYLPFERL